MSKLCFGVIVLVVYGSLWPFVFLIPDGEPYRAFLNTVYRDYRLNDLIMNLGLFLPIGFFGLLSARDSGELPRRAVVVLVGGVSLALALQIAQIYVPARLPDLHDVLWNSVGLILGLSLAWLLRRATPNLEWGQLNMPFVPAMLICAWGVYRLAPFAPSLDPRSLERSLAPLISMPELQLGVILHDSIAWLVVASLIATSISPSRRLLLAIMTGSFLIEILVLFNAVTYSEIFSAIIALSISKRLFSNEETMNKAIIILIVFLIFYDFLWPIVLTNGFLLFFDPISTRPPFIRKVSHLIIISNYFFLYGSFLYFSWLTLCRSTLNKQN